MSGTKGSPVSHTGHPKRNISEDSRRDHFVSPRAHKYGRMTLTMLPFGATGFHFVDFEFRSCLGVACYCNLCGSLAKISRLGVLRRLQASRYLKFPMRFVTEIFCSGILKFVVHFNDF